MGVADNRTYKNEYLFTGKYDSILKGPSETAKDNPSINVDPKINSTIKENPYRSNVEIEGDEIVLQPDLSALFKAVGKSHKQGGMDVLLRPDSFVFSDFEDLKLSPKDHELFELKEGGKKATNTPADVLKRNVDLKHYNNLVTILEDPFKDDLAKNSAAKMLDKYIKTLGNVAFIQESKKGMPQGVPDFAMGTAPVYDPQLKERIMENKQYAKAGGRVNNPYQDGGRTSGSGQKKVNPLDLLWPTQPYQSLPITPTSAWSRSSYGPTTPISSIPTIQLSDEDVYGKKPDTNMLNWGLWKGDKLPIFQNRYNTTNAADKINNLDVLATKVGYTGPKDNKSFQKWLYNSSPENKAVIDKWHGTYNVGPNDGMFDGKIGIRWANALKEITDKPAQPRAKITITPSTPVTPATNPDTPTIDENSQGQVQANWKFTPWQKLSHLNDWMNWANVDKYGARRARYDATYINPALVNPEQAVGDVRALANQQITAANVLNPILRNAQGSQAFGQTLNAIPGIRSQYDNQNAGIVNQFRQYNNQVKNNETLVNMQNDMNYERDSTTADVNYKNMKNYLKNQALSNTMTDVATNQKLAYNLLTQNNPAYGFDWDTGNFYRNKKNILDVQSSQTKGIYDDIIEGIKKLPDTDSKKWEIYEKLLRQKNILPYLQSSNPMGKKGGKVKNPYK